MDELDHDIDALYRGPLDAFTEARNALAKSAKRPDLKTLEKPSLPAWAVNQLHWHRRAVVERLEQAAEAMREQHRRALAGKPADIADAERTHREVVRDALAEARAILVEAGHPATPATLDAVRETLQALPSPEAQGRLTRPLAPKGFEALAGFAVAAAARPHLRVVEGKKAADDHRATDTKAAKETKTEARAKAKAEAEADAEAEAEAARARARKEAEREARERRKAAEKALEAARAVLRRTEIALDDAERTVKKRTAERDAAAAAHAAAQRELDALDG